MLHNLRYTCRVLRRNPVYTVVAICSLTLAIGANTAIFSLIDALLLRDLPVRRPSQLVQLWVRGPNGHLPFSYPMFRELESSQRVFSDLVAWTPNVQLNVAIGGVPSPSRVLAVSDNYYSALGVSPLLGRLIGPRYGDVQSGSTVQVAVISYEFWWQRFGGTSSVIGKRIEIENQSFTIIGVTRQWFGGVTVGTNPDITIPVVAFAQISKSSSISNLDNRSLLWLYITGRLRDGVTIYQARSQLLSFWPEVLQATASTETPGPRRDRFLAMELDVVSARTGIAPDLRAQFSRPLYVLWGIVALILLVACVNVANLLLARAAARSHEMSIRIAIGATRWAVVSQVLAESLALCFLSGLLGLGFAYWGSHALVDLMTQNDSAPVLLNLRPDLRVCFIAFLAAVLTAILISLGPAFRQLSRDPADVLQSTRAVAGGGERSGKVLIVIQVAISVVVLLSAGLFLQTFEKLHSVKVGFEKQNLFEISLQPRPARPHDADLKAYRRLLIERLLTVPGVHSATFADQILAPYPWRDTISIVPLPANAATPFTDEIAIWPGFFGTLGIKLIRGRDFSITDDISHPRVGIISRSLAERLFPDSDALGKHIRFGVLQDFQNIEIVGVAADARVFDVRDASPLVLYQPSLQTPHSGEFADLYVRTNGILEGTIPAIARDIDSFGYEYATNTENIKQVINSTLVDEQAVALLAGFFACLALLLAGIGLYGLVSYVGSRRTREMGIRLTLGAQRTNILWLVLREALLPVVFGIILGVPCAFTATRLMTTMLFGVSPDDLTTTFVISALLLAVTAAASYLPAHRASVTDPVVALRVE